MSGHRKKWELSSNGTVHQISSKPTVSVQTPHSRAYEQYLTMLQERNRYKYVITYGTGNLAYLDYTTGY